MALSARRWVAPDGAILDRSTHVGVRGRVMGNRGILEREGKPPRDHDGTAWILCDPDHVGGDAASRSYTVLFFMDEATALAAGHRPCWTCLKPRAQLFLDLWRREVQADARLRDDLDRQLHAERRSSEASPVREVAALPHGTFVDVAGEPHVVDGALLRRWTPTGYTTSLPVADVGEARLLTPPSTVRVLAAGYPVGELGPRPRP